MNDIEVNSAHPANAGILCFLKRRSETFYGSSCPPSVSPKSIENPYDCLGTHPDLVQWLWDKITAKLPVCCSWVVYGAPVLVHPTTGVIFAFACGTGPYALRLPQSEREELSAIAAKNAEGRADKFQLHGEQREKYLAQQTGRLWQYDDGSGVDLMELGDEWVFGHYLAVLYKLFCRKHPQLERRRALRGWRVV
jgi:hypothetical protein